MRRGYLLNRWNAVLRSLNRPHQATPRTFAAPSSPTRRQPAPSRPPTNTYVSAPSYEDEFGDNLPRSSSQVSGVQGSPALSAAAAAARAEANTRRGVPRSQPPRSGHRSAEPPNHSQGRSFGSGVASSTTAAQTAQLSEEDLRQRRLQRFS